MENMTNEFLKRLDERAKLKLNTFEKEANKALRELSFKYGIQEVVFETKLELSTYGDCLIIRERKAFEEKALAILKEKELEEFENTLKNISWALQGQF